ncbi:MAG: hypothetical protein ABIJ09_21920 [Pseudomonadota bacterium]
MAAVAALVAAAMALGCSHTTTISARQQGTRFYLDDELIGTDSVTTDVANGLGSSYRIRAEVEGRDPMEIKIERQHVSWPTVITALGGGLASGCVTGCLGFWVFGATTSDMIPDAGVWFTAASCTGALAGVLGVLPVASLMLWMNHGPDTVDIDLETRQVATVPPTQVTILNEVSSKASVQVVPDADTTAPGQATPEVPAPAPQPQSTPAQDVVSDPGMQPFDY